MKQIRLLLIYLLMVFSSHTYARTATTTIVNDTFDVGSLTTNDDADDPSDIQWWSVPSLTSFSIAVSSTTDLIINSGKSLTGADLSNGSPSYQQAIGRLPSTQTLGSTVGDKLILSCDIGVGVVTEQTGNRFVLGLYNSNGTVPISSGTTYSTNDFGYAGQLPFASYSLCPANTLKESGTTGNIANGADFVITGTSANTFYIRSNAGKRHLTLTLTRAANGVTVDFVVMNGTSTVSTASYTDTTNVYTQFDEILIATNAGGGTLVSYSVDNVKLDSVVSTNSITTSASPSDEGTTTGDGVYTTGATATVVATPNTNYSFVNWTEGGAEVSTSANYTFAVNADRTLVANFVPNTYTINASASPADEGTVSGAGVYNSGTTATVIATPNANYSFVNWTENDTPVSTSASYSFTVNGGRTLVANFVPITYSISTVATPDTYGSTTGGGIYNSGTTATVIATPNTNYSFVNWTEGGVPVSTSASYTFTVDGPHAFVANFQPITYTISSSVAPLLYGSISGNGVYNAGSQATLIATPSSNDCSFVNWTENGTQVSTSASFTFTVGADRTFVANFKLNTTPGWSNVAIGGGGAVTGIYADPNTSGRFYMRTDVGGAYRWDSGTAEWAPITESFSGVTDANNFGIESLAVDPNTAGTVYVLTGKYSYDAAKIYKTTNAGDALVTWTSKGIPTGLKCTSNGNDHGKCGERLAVDPNNSNVLFVATRTVGLWKSVNGATSWTKVMQSGTIPFPSGDATSGLTFVAFDKNGGLSGTTSAVIYVGVYDTGTSGNGGIWRTTNGGSNWTHLTGGKLTPARGTVASDGTLFTTCLGTGTTSALYGGVFKAARTDMALTDITPPVGNVSSKSKNHSFGALAVDPTNPAKVYVSDYYGDYSLNTHVTTTAGASWTVAGNVHGTTNLQTRQGSQWFGNIGQLAINPFNTKEVWMADWLGILRTSDITVTTTPWNYLYQGHEEVVPLDLQCAPSGAPLLAGIADVCGTRQVNVDLYQPTMNSFLNSSTPACFGSTTSLDFCEANPNRWARVADLYYTGSVGYSSTNNGQTWTAFTSIPSGATGGRIAMSATDPAKIVWTAENGKTYYTTTSGSSWTQATTAPGIGSLEFDQDRRFLASDRVDGNTFYICQNVSVQPLGYAQIWKSVNAGASWAVAGTCAYTSGSTQYAYKMATAPGITGEIWVGIPGTGIYRSTNGGTSFTLVPGLTGSVLIGFGKPAPGHTNPAVFYRGSVSGVSGTFRSDDASDPAVITPVWKQINDVNAPINDVPQLITGDRQTFGRVYIGTDGRGIYVGDSN